MRLLILIGLISLNFAYAQMAESVTVRGVEYQFVGDSNAKYRVSGDYSSVDPTNLNTYLDVFVRDAIINGKDLNLAHNSRERHRIVYGSALNLSINSIVFVPNSFYSNQRIAGSSWLRAGVPGFLITINEQYWNSASDRDKFKLVYHELGHALLQLGHICNSTKAQVPSGPRSWTWVTERAIMATAECLENFRVWSSYDGEYIPRPGPGYEVLGYNCLDSYPGHCNDWGLDFRDLSDLMNNFYTETTPLGSIRNSVSSKGGIISVIHD